MATAEIFFDTTELDRLAVDLDLAAARVGFEAAAVVRKSAYEIQQTAKVLAPVDTGALRSSITVDFVGDGRGGSMEAEIGPTVDYGVFQEFGTSKMAPQPYLGPALDRHADGFEQGIADIAATVLDG